MGSVYYWEGRHSKLASSQKWNAARSWLSRCGVLVFSLADFKAAAAVIVIATE